MEHTHPLIPIKQKTFKKDKISQFNQLAPDPNGELSLKSLSTPLTRLPKARQDEIDSAILNMVIVDMVPLCCVEKEGFQNVVQTLSPHYALPSRKKLASTLDQFYSEERSRLVQFVRTHGKHLAYTTDLWKSAAKEYFISVAVHFIDDNWNLHSPLLATKHIKGILYFILYFHTFTNFC